MKIRSLHPQFFTDPKVCALPAFGRLLFQGLWLYADDYGRGYWLPKTIEGLVFPRDDVDIESLLAELCKRGLIRRFSDGEDEFYEIPTWSRYQSPKYQAKTDIPDPKSLENPYATSPGQFGTELVPNPVQVVPNFSPGEGEGEGEGEGVVIDASHRNIVWDTLVEIYGEPTPPQRSLYGRVSRFIIGMNATTDAPNEIRNRAEAIVDKWGPQANTITALEKWWNYFDSPAGQLTEANVDEYRKQQERARRLEEAERLDRALGASE